jgi:hypothetical protein
VVVGDGYHLSAGNGHVMKTPGEVRERPNRTHSKCVVLQGTVGSNPTLSAKANNNAPSQNGRGIVFDRINRCSRTVRNRSEKKPQANRKGPPPPKNYRRNMATMVRSQNEASAFHSPRWVPTHEVIDVVKAPSNALAAAEESSTRYKPRAKPCS